MLLHVLLGGWGYCYFQSVLSHKMISYSGKKLRVWFLNLECAISESVQNPPQGIYLQGEGEGGDVKQVLFFYLYDLLYLREQFFAHTVKYQWVTVTILCIQLNLCKLIVQIFPHRTPGGCGHNPGWCQSYIYIIWQTCLFTQGWRNVSSSKMTVLLCWILKQWKKETCFWFLSAILPSVRALHYSTGASLKVLVSRKLFCWAGGLVA